MKKLLLLLLIVPMVSFGQYGQQPIQVELSGQRPTYTNPNPQPIQVQVQGNSSNNVANSIQQAGQVFSNSINSAALNAASNAASNRSNAPAIYLDKKSLMEVELNSYKYIVIQESNFNSYRKTSVKTLKKAGFNVVNLHKTSRTHNAIPSDLKQNPDLGLYLYLDVVGFGTVEAIVRLLNHQNKLLYNSNGHSSWSGGNAVKNALSSLEASGYKYDPNLIRKKPVKTAEKLSKTENNKDKGNIANELKKLKELLDLGILTQEEYDKKAASLKKILLGN